MKVYFIRFFSVVIPSVAIEEIWGIHGGWNSFFLALLVGVCGIGTAIADTLEKTNA